MKINFILFKRLTINSSDHYNKECKLLFDMTEKYLIILLVILSVGGSLQDLPLLTLTPDNQNDICQYFADNTIIRKPGFCDRSIKCIGGSYVEDTLCSGTTPYFSLSTGKCASSVSDSYCKTPCKSKSPTFVADPINCNNWYKCDDSKQIGFGTCPANQLFDPTNSACTYDYTCPGHTYKFCDVVPTKVKIWDPDNCHKYYECSSGSASLKQCDTGKYFHLDAGECVPKGQVDCYKHPVPANVCGTEKLAIRGKFVNDQATCNGFFYCKDLGSGKPDPDPQWDSCKDGLFFDFEHQACIDRTGVTCSEDRCIGRGNGRTISETKGCRSYLQCKDNYTIKEDTCLDGLYFNENSQECETGPFSYGVCL